MRSTRFSPVGVDVLEDRLVLSSFSNPITITVVPTPPGHVNPKFLVLTKQTEAQIAPAIDKAFARFDATLTKDVQNIATAYFKSGTPPAKLLAEAPALLNTAVTKLSSDLLAVAHKLPFGGTNTYPVFEARVTGASAGPAAAANFTLTGLESELGNAANYAGAQAELIIAAAGSPSAARSSLTTLENATLTEGTADIASTRDQVQTDVTDYINLGVTDGYFTLGKGATLPALSQPLD